MSENRSTLRSADELDTKLSMRLSNEDFLTLKGRALNAHTSPGRLAKQLIVQSLVAGDGSGLQSKLFEALRKIDALERSLSDVGDEVKEVAKAGREKKPTAPRDDLDLGMAPYLGHLDEAQLHAFGVQATKLLAKYQGSLVNEDGRPLIDVLYNTLPVNQQCWPHLYTAILWERRLGKRAVDGAQTYRFLAEIRDLAQLWEKAFLEYHYLRMHPLQVHFGQNQTTFWKLGPISDDELDEALHNVIFDAKQRRLLITKFSQQIEDAVALDG
jgi:hypothetical protein